MLSQPNDSGDGLSPDKARLLKDLLILQLESVEYDETSGEQQYVRVFAEYVKQIIKTLGAHEAPPLIQAIATAFNLSTLEVAGYINDNPPVVEERRDELDLEVTEEVLLDVFGKESLLGKYLELTHPLESPAIYNAAALLTFVSAGMKRKGVIDFEFFKVYPNLYTLLIGSSGVKKSSAVGYALKLLTEADPNIHVLPREGSPQGLAQALQERHQRHGTADGLFYSPELTVTFGKDKYKRSLGTWVTDWFDSDDNWSRRLQGLGQITLQNLYITQLGCSNETFLRDLPEEMIKGGYFPRTWILYARAKKHWKWKPREKKVLRDEIVRTIRRRVLAVPNIITLTPEADRVFEWWYEHVLEKESRLSSPTLKEYYERAHIIALKLAAVLTVAESDNPVAVTPETVHKAIRLMELTRPGTELVLKNVSVSNDGELVKAIIDYIKVNSGRVPEKKLERKLQLTYAPFKIKQTIQALVLNGTLTMFVGNAEKWLALQDMEA